MSNLNIPRGAELSGTDAPAGSSAPRYPTALSAGATIGDYEIVRVIGQGGFGIVYLAYDRALARLVAVKEYFPATMATRSADGTTVAVRSPEVEVRYRAGLAAFVGEARLLARFDHPSLVSIHRFWEANGTAFMVMPFYEGRTLLDTRRALGRPASESWLRNTLMSMLGALELLHGANCLHRDISPENILVLPDGRAVLLDYAVLPSLDEAGEHTTILKPTWAPIEQFAESAEHPQGPWSDLYSLAAVGYFCVAGRPPPPSTSRALDRESGPGPLGRVLPTILNVHPGSTISEGLVSAIDWGLAVRPGDRPQTVAAWRAVLTKSRGATPASESVDLAVATNPAPTMPPPIARSPGAAADAASAPVMPAASSPVGGSAAPVTPAAADDSELRKDPFFASGALPPKGAASINESLRGLSDLPAGVERSTQVDTAILNAIDAALSGFGNLDGSGASGAASNVSFGSTVSAQAAMGAAGAAGRLSTGASSRRSRRKWVPVAVAAAALMLVVLAWTAFNGGDEAATSSAEAPAGSSEGAAPPSPGGQAPRVVVPDTAPAPAAVAAPSASAAVPAEPVAATPVPPVVREAPAEVKVPVPAATAAATAASASSMGTPDVAAPQAPAATAAVPVPVPPAAVPPRSDRSAGGAAPVVPGSAEPNNPRAVCGPRSNFALLRCMEMQCQRSKFTQHPQCISLRESGEVE